MSLKQIKILAVLVCLLATGCNQQSPFVSQQGMTPQTGQDAQVLAQMRELNDRLARFDSDNRDLTNQIAQLQQKNHLAEDEKMLLKKQLGDVTKHMQLVESSKTDSEKKLTALQASTRFKGGATLTANNSMQNSLKAIQIPGIDVRLDGDLVRIELPADRLFLQGSTQLQQGGIALLNQAAAAVRKSYSRQYVAIEGHTDNAPSVGTVLNAQQLTANQSLAVYSQLSRSGALPERQMFLMSMGANRPRFSNGDPAGRARNRRIELVVYPESFDGS